MGGQRWLQQAVGIHNRFIASSKVIQHSGFAEDKLAVSLSEDAWKKLLFSSTAACTDVGDIPRFFVPMQLYPKLTVWCLQQVLQ